MATGNSQLSNFTANFARRHHKPEKEFAKTGSYRTPEMRTAELDSGSRN